MPTTSTLSVAVDGIDSVPLTLSTRGAGRPILLLHGGMGPASVLEFAELLACSEPARVLAPIHPGFAGTSRPEELTSVRGLAALYVELLEQLDLADVTVVGHSIGGWIAAEMAALGSSRICGTVLVDAVGMDVPGHPPADFFGLTPDELADRAYHDPAAFRLDLGALSPEQLQVMAGNREALRLYGGVLTDPGLAARVSTVTTPTIVIWGASDRIVTPDYGRAYAAAIPGATFRLLPATGHVAPLETPTLLLDAILELTASTH